MKLNLSKQLNQVKQLNEDLSNKLISNNLKIGQYLDPTLYDLCPDYSYKITGGSTISGTPARKYISAYNPVRERVKGRRKLLRVVGNQVTSNWSVIDLKVQKLNLRPQE